MKRPFLQNEILFATHNVGKLDEVRALLRPYGVAVRSAADFELPVPEETEDSFEGNARIKARAAARLTGLVSLADDSGLCVDALGGAPGVHTADWAEGPDGRDFERAMERIHEALLEAGASQPWTASFHSVLVVAWPNGSDVVFEGVVDGRLAWPTRGELGHGYDPMFVPDGMTQTFAEMTKEEKNGVSHRSKALSAMAQVCFT